MAVFLLIVLLPLLGCLATAFFGCILRWQAAKYISVLVMFVATVLGIAQFIHALLGYAPEAKSLVLLLYPFIHIQTLTVYWGLQVDALARVMIAVVTTISFVVHVYSLGYMSNDESQPRFFSYISLFTFFMLALVTAPNLVQLFFGWEGVGLASYLLIGFWFHKESANQASMKAFIVNRVGDFGLILGIALIFMLFGTMNINLMRYLIDHEGIQNVIIFGHSLSILNIVGLLLFMGCMGKSAQFFLHTWLPDAMEGPTPVSALIHAATMVTAGVFLLARLDFLYIHAPIARDVILFFGGTTAFFAATIAIAQTDIKRVIAYSTCSQLGYMFVAMGAGAYTIGIFHLFTHAFFKALLFLCAGSVIHAVSGKQDMRDMGGLRRPLKITFITMVIGTLAITGFPLTAGYYSKDAIISSSYLPSSYIHMYAYIMSVLAVFLTSLYSWRLIFLTFFGETRLDKDRWAHVHESPWIMSIPLIFLAFMALVAGFIFAPFFMGTHATSFWHYIIPTHVPHEPIWVDILFPTSMMLGGFLTAWFCYVYSPSFPAEITARFNFLYSFLLNKWWFDELYHYIFVVPVRFLGKFFWIEIDKNLIDRCGPDGLSYLTRCLSRCALKMQTGYVYHYTLAAFLGLFGFLTYFLWR